MNEMKTDNYEYFIDPDVNCIFIRHKGKVTQEVVVQRGERVSLEPNYRPNLNRLIDLRGCEIDLSREALVHIASMMQKATVSRGTYTEVLIVDSLLAHGVVRMLLSLMDEKQVSYIILHASDKDLELKVRASLGIPREYQIPELISMIPSPEKSEATVTPQ